MPDLSKNNLSYFVSVHLNSVILYSQTPIKRTPLGPRLGVRLIGVGTVGGAHGLHVFLKT